MIKAILQKDLYRNKIITILLVIFIMLSSLLSASAASIFVKLASSMIGIYFSGSGNTAYCVKLFLNAFEPGSEMYSIEDKNALSALAKHTDILLAYPIYYSALPKIMKDFLVQTAFQGKRVFLLATMGLFSGDGSGCAARLLKPYGATILGGLHVKMPDCIADEKELKRPLEKKQGVDQGGKSKNRAGSTGIQGRKASTNRSWLFLSYGWLVWTAAVESVQRIVPCGIYLCLIIKQSLMECVRCAIDV